MGTLYLVGTPIGNLEDITYRAVRILGDVDLIAAEDTRHSGRLLKHYGIETRLVSFHGHSPVSRLTMLLKELETSDVALISDAGMPVVSDPGASLVRGAVDRGHRVEVVPGASAVTSAVAISSIVESGFLFAGYPPRRSRERREFLTRLSHAGYPIVLFESPHRLLATLGDLESQFPDVRIAVCRELTKLHEEVVRGTVADVVGHFREHAPRGEFVIVLGVVDRLRPETDLDTEAIASQLLSDGLSTSAAARELAHLTSLSRSEAYAVVMQVRMDVERDKQ